MQWTDAGQVREWKEAPKPSESTCLSPQRRTGGSWAQGPGMWPQPPPGRAILGGASGCLEPLPWIHVELIGQEDAGCPVSGGSEASMWCFCNTTQPGPRVVDPPPRSPDHGAVCRHLLCFPVWGEMGTGLSRHPGPESLLAGPVLEASSSSLGPKFAGFKLQLLVLTKALNFTELPSYQPAHSLQLPCSRSLDLREQCCLESAEVCT